LKLVWAVPRHYSEPGWRILAVLTCKSNTAVFLYILQAHIVNGGREVKYWLPILAFMKRRQYRLLSTYQILEELFEAGELLLTTLIKSVEGTYYHTCLQRYFSIDNVRVIYIKKSKFVKNEHAWYTFERHER
jgi:hypothetical protein